MNESRVKKTLLNARVSLLFYFITLFISFFSRKIFLEYLGADFMGLTGTLGNILGFLNLADLGIGSTIGYTLYKPLYEKDQRKIIEIISVFGYLYRIVGIIILGCGILTSFFLPIIFPDIPFGYGIVYYAFFAFLSSSLFGYFINYRYTLFGADQKSYLITAYFQTGNVCKTLIQMALIYYTRNLFLWVSIELAFGILYCFILNWKIRQVYPWLKTSISLGKMKQKEYSIILNKAKQMFVHVLAGTGRTQALPLLIYKYASLSSVTFYGNYMLIVDKVTALLNSLMASTSAGVGSLVAEGDKKKILEIFWQLQAIRFYVAGVIAFGLYNLLSPFVSIWLGAEYVLPNAVLYVILTNLFMKLTRITNDEFIYAYGLYQDTWAPIVTLIITIAAAIIGGYHYGLAGVIAGDAVSVILIIFTWKPIFLYWKGFQLPILSYWRKLCVHFAALLLAWVLAVCLVKFVPLNPKQDYWEWALYALCSIVCFGAAFFILLYLSCRGMRSFTDRFILPHMGFIGKKRI